MGYTEKPAKTEMPRRRIRGGARQAAMLAGLLSLGGCATYNPVALYHRMLGGAPGQKPPPAPGLSQPAPHIGSVPTKPPPLSPRLQRTIRSQLQAANRTQNALPAPGGGVAPNVLQAPSPAAPPPPLLIGFQPHRAIVSHRDRAALVALAAKRGTARIAAIGFSPDRTGIGLHLALRRAAAIADVLTASGVPGAAIRIEALTSGRGGAAQLLYPQVSK